jgi:hypothetical protein
MTEYTREQVLNEPVGYRLNEWVTEYVMDVPVREKKRRFEYVHVPSYSRDISVAWEVVEKIREQGLYAEIRLISNSVSCIFRNNMGGIVEVVHDCETVPLAISRASLLAVMGE